MTSINMPAPNWNNWTLGTMQMINDLTPNIQGKAFNPDWFLLRNRFDERDRELAALQKDAARWKAWSQAMSEASQAHDGSQFLKEMEKLTMGVKRAYTVEQINNWSDLAIINIASKI